MELVDNGKLSFTGIEHQVRLNAATIWRPKDIAVLLRALDI